MDMNTKDNGAERGQITRLLPDSLSVGLSTMGVTQWQEVEEVRLRVGQPMTVVTPNGEKPVKGAKEPITSQQLMRVLEIATQASVHTALTQVNQGYFIVEGGHRIGICGRVLIKGDGTWHMTQISSLSLRVARERLGNARGLLPALFYENRLHSTLILAPPGMGKTTLLRDIIRSLSDGEGGTPFRVGVADERGELCGMWQGRPQFSIGSHTDVLDGCPKGEGLMVLLRGMNPQVLVADEMTHPKDIDALEMASHCGVALMVTAHGYNLADLSSRPLYRRLLKAHVFTKLIFITKQSGERAYQVMDLEGAVL